MECRFALMIEDDGEPTRVGPMGIPMTARIGVIVYARVGGVRARAAHRAAAHGKIDGVWVPALRVTNTGSATGRLSGFLNGRDGTGQRMDLAPASSPILPGMSALIGLMPSAPVDRPGDPPPPILSWPMAVRGTLEVGREVAEAKLPLDAAFQAP